jgi:hypothetical protein
MREVHIFQDTNVVLQEWRVEETYGESGLPCRKQTSVKLIGVWPAF